MLLFVTFFTVCNFLKLLFTVEKGQRNCFISYIHCSGGRGVPLYIYFLILLLLRGRGGFKFMFYFSPSFDMWKEEGKGSCSFSNFFSSLLNG